MLQSWSSHQLAAQGDLCQNHWVWNKDDKSPSVQLSHDREAAYFHVDPIYESHGTAGVRGDKGFLRGEHYWEITFLEPPRGTSVMIGVATEKALLHTSYFKFVNLIGLDEESWGLSYRGSIWHGGESWPYCEPFYEEGTVIGVHLNLYLGTLTFYKNGQSLGTAFRGLHKLGTKLYPIISSTAADTELQVGTRVCRYASLQEKCNISIAHSLRARKDVEVLPLPRVLKDDLEDLLR